MNHVLTGSHFSDIFFASIAAGPHLQAHSHMHDAMWNLRLFTGKKERGTVQSACSAAGVNICVLATVINSNEMWGFSKHRAITISLTKSINTVCRCQEKNMKRKKVFMGPGVWFITDVHFWEKRANMTSTFGKNFVLSCGHYRAWSQMVERSVWMHETHRHACVGVTAHKCTHLVSTQSCDALTHLHKTFAQ